MTQEIVVLAAVIVCTLSAARLTRLITQDSFPPAVWFRIKWDDITGESGWNTLLHCHWCMAPWMVLPLGAWGWLSNLHVSWWVFNLWLAVSYIASMIVERDEKE